MLEPGRVLVLYGPRRSGKTTLLDQYLKKTKFKYRFDVGDNIKVADILGSRDFEKILEHVEGLDLYVIDEAQNIPGIGMGLKIIVDQRPDIRVIATGSSSFDLAQNIGEPLVGRKKTITLYPVSQQELLSQYVNKSELKEAISDYLIYGSYPKVITLKSKEKKREYLDELVNSYLLRDILSLEQVKSPILLINLLKLLAFQVGSLVSLNELSNKLDIHVSTVARYLDLLEKSFVIFRRGPYSRNLRSEITSKNKYYFLDNGIRNGVIGQYNELDMRDDVGALWENFVVSERAKYRSYNKIYGSSYYWRTHQGQEVDLVEEREGKLYGYECKWSNKKISQPPHDWTETYPHATYELIHRDNYLHFLL
jgi:predicted AAA+ superfamily ATPase